MSGFVAVFDRGGTGIPIDDFKTMLDSIDHRGPDGSGIWYDDDIALGHQQLQSTPESRFDTQPYRDEDLVFVGDVRLDNRGELISNLSISEPVHRIPDSHLLLSAYKKWGKQCLEQLVGAFAFVIWDRSNNKFICVRDHFGIKPFYYHEGDDMFAVASEKKALLAHPSIPGNIDNKKIGDFLLNDYSNKERSYFESIKRLPPAYRMSITQNGVSTNQYWDLDPTRTVTLESDNAYERRFRELLEKAVESRLRTTGSVGTALSGGIDSSVVTVIARNLLPETDRLYTFSNIYDNSPSSNEREYIESVLSHDSFEPQYIYDDNDESVLFNKREIYKYFDQPVYNSMSFSSWKRLKHANKAGISVMLGGEMGDTTIGYGLELLPELFFTGRWIHLYKEIRDLSSVLDAKPTSIFKNNILTEIIPDLLLRFRQQIKKDTTPAKLENPTIKTEFTDQLNISGRYNSMCNKKSILPRRARKIQYDGLHSSTLIESFEEKDLMNAFFGIEPRYPFADKRLVEFTLAIPATQQLRDGWTKSIARRSVQDLLPKKVESRPWKTRMNEAFYNALWNENARLKCLTNNSNSLSQYIDLNELDDTMSRFENTPNSRDARVLWRALSLSIWLRNHKKNTGED